MFTGTVKPRRAHMQWHRYIWNRGEVGWDVNSYWHLQTFQDNQKKEYLFKCRRLNYSGRTWSGHKPHIVWSCEREHVGVSSEHNLESQVKDRPFNASCCCLLPAYAFIFRQSCRFCISPFGPTTRLFQVAKSRVRAMAALEPTARRAD